MGCCKNKRLFEPYDADEFRKVYKNMPFDFF